MGSAKNSLGRGTGRRFNMAAIKRELQRGDAAKAAKSAKIYQARLDEIAYAIAHPANPFTGMAR